MSLRRCESPGVIAQIAALSVDHAPTAIIGCPYTSRHDTALPSSYAQGLSTIVRMIAASGPASVIPPSDRGITPHGARAP
jgi:hypothetical protein